MDTEALAPEAGGGERRLRKSLGFWQLTAIGFSGVIGSGWLLGAMYAAQYAEPGAIASWVIGGVVLALIALVMASPGGAGPKRAGWCAGRTTPTAGSPVTEGERRPERSQR